jgi:hypothetical protein
VVAEFAVPERSELHVQFAKPLLPAQEFRSVPCGKPEMVESGLPTREPGTSAIGGAGSEKA